MKHIENASLRILAVSGLLLLLIGCVAEVDGGYHRGGPWYHDGPWFDGPGWGAPRGGVNVDIHPPGFRR